MQVKLGHTGIWMFPETIRHSVAQILGHIGTTVYREITVFAIGPQVVYAADMVIMAVGQKRSVEMRRTEPENLLSEIRAAVDEETTPPDVNDGRRAQALVKRICRTADLTVAADLRDAGRCSAAKNSQFHIVIL
jgi:hypothetical protein